MTTNNKNGSYMAIAIIAILAVIVVIMLMQPIDESSTALGRAVEDMADGVEDAVEELDPDRTTGEKIGDAVEDAGENIQDAAGN